MHIPLVMDPPNRKFKFKSSTSTRYGTFQSKVPRSTYTHIFFYKDQSDFLISNVLKISTFLDIVGPYVVLNFDLKFHLIDRK